MPGYESGKRNIGAEDVKMRYYGSLVMFLIVAAFIGITFYYPQSATSLSHYITLFFITFSALIMYLQSRNSFCTGLALKGKQKTEDEPEKVERREKVWKDRKKAALMFVQSLAFSAVLTGLVYLAVNYIGFLPILG